MQYRTDVKNDKELSALGFGCMRFPTRGTGIDIDASELLVLTAIAQGVNYFDTAYAYSGNEQALGEIFKRNPGIVDLINIASKVPISRCEHGDDLDKYLTKSLERMGIDCIDYYLIHNVTSVATWEKLSKLGFEDWVARQKEAGRIKRIGFSWHGPEGEFIEFLDSYDWDFCQIQYNYMNEHYQAGTAGLEAAAERGIPVVVMEPLLGGKLASPLPDDAKKVLADAGQSEDAVRLALRWVWDHPGVTCVLSGMNAMEQLEQNVATAEGALPGSFTEAEFKAVELAQEAIARNFKVPCTGCGYCLPCPQGINIPVCFNAYNQSYAYGWMDGVSRYVTASGVMVGEPHLASDCTRCGACVKKCPQSIAIPDELVRVKRRLQVPGMAHILKIGTRFISR